MQKLSAFLGNIPQWLSALAAIVVAVLGIYGINRAVPYFENANLREANGRLEIKLRRLEDEQSNIRQENIRLQNEKANLDNAAQDAYRALNQSGELARRLAFIVVCNAAVRSAAEVTTKSINDTYTIGMALVGRQVYPAEAATKQLLVRDVFEKGTSEHLFKFLPADDRERLRRDWANIASSYRQLLDLVLVPNSVPWAPTTRAYLDGIHDNLKVAWALQTDIGDACVAAAQIP